MRKITVSGENGYEILLGRGLLENCGEYIRQVSSAQKVRNYIKINLAQR